MITSFRDNNLFLSNMYETPVEFYGLIYPSAENAFQAMKCQNPEQYKEFLSIKPTEAKKKGRNVSLRPDWDKVKYQFMRSIVDAKFKDPKMLKMLLGTEGESLVEGNFWHDNYWGMCQCDMCKGKRKYNYLGELLMRTRNLSSSSPDLFTMYQQGIIRRSDGYTIEVPAVLYDKNTHTVLKIGEKATCIEYLMKMEGKLLTAATIYTWEDDGTMFWRYKACEDMNRIVSCTGSLPYVLRL